MAKKQKKVKKKNKEKHLIGKKEFLFNFFSLVSIICIGIYFGYRGLYYYSRQNQKIKYEATTLNGTIIQNSPLVQGDSDGFHHDASGYFFKGDVHNNYVIFENRLFRVVRINADNTVKLVSDGLVAVFPWGEESNYKDSNVRYWLEKNQDNYSGVYYNSFTSVEDYLVKTSYEVPIFKDNKIQTTDEKYEDFFSILTVSDYVLANGKNSYLNTGKTFFLLGLNQDKENLFVDEEGSLENCDSLDGYGIRPVFTIKANTKIQGGNGTLESPYIIQQESKNYIDGYVKLGDDIWKISYDYGDSLKLYLNGYIMSNGKEVVKNYSKTNSIFDISDRNSLAYYLNNAYLSSLKYSSLLLNFDSFTGEISTDEGYQYTNIYKESISTKVSLLNIFDYVSNNDIFDYFYVNTTSQVGSMGYNIQAAGVLEESDVREEKHIVPVVSIEKSSIKGGQGTLNDPYVVE